MSHWKKQGLKEIKKQTMFKSLWHVDNTNIILFVCVCVCVCVFFFLFFFFNIQMKSIIITHKINKYMYIYWKK